jgi:hypothetical protein
MAIALLHSPFSAAAHATGFRRMRISEVELPARRSESPRPRWQTVIILNFDIGYSQNCTIRIEVDLMRIGGSRLRVPQAIQVPHVAQDVPTVEGAVKSTPKRDFIA